MPTIEDVKRTLWEQGIAGLEFEEPTPNSQAAAKAVGCSVGEIAKSILLLVGGVPLMVVTSGDVKVKNSKLRQATGLTGKIRFPDADDVLRHTGYAPGGVCPFLLPADLRVLVDTSMRRFPRVYAAAGNDHSAVPVLFDQLLSITGGEETDVCEISETT